MCGIAAIFAYNENGKTFDPVRWLEIANRVQRPRGPDGEGTWVSENGLVGLAHRRLAIIDLSPAGAQPMATEDGLLRITYNGEIYNYKALRASLETRGYRFQSSSDTEVLLHLYREYGQAMVEHLRGMYAFVLWDAEKHGLFMARDPFGIKPLYYSDDGCTLRVASQVKTLLAAGCPNTEPEPAGHVGFFLWGFVPEPFTLYKGIRALAAGTSLWVVRGDTHPKLSTFCDVARELAQPVSPIKRITLKETADAFGEALQDSVRHHMVADVPVGVFLSAGLDSTSIAALAAGCSQEGICTFTLGFEEYRGTLNDESLLAEMVADTLGTQHETGWVRGREFEQELEKIFSAMDQPSIDGVNTYFVSKAAAQSGLKVALSGLGGDELLGGYPSFAHIPKIMKVAGPFHAMGKAFRIVSEPVFRRFTSPKYAGVFEYGNTLGGAYLLRRGLFMPWELPRLMDPDMVKEGWRELAPMARINETIPKGSTNMFSVVSALESAWYMRNMLLRDSDWASMAHSLEIRVPLVDLKLARTIAPLMQQDLRPDKEMMARIAWAGKPPSEIINRPKTGFSIPVQQWLLKGAHSGKRGQRAWAMMVYNALFPSRMQQSN